MEAASDHGCRLEIDVELFGRRTRAPRQSGAAGSRSTGQPCSCSLSRTGIRVSKTTGPQIPRSTRAPGGLPSERTDATRLCRVSGNEAGLGAGQPERANRFGSRAFTRPALGALSGDVLIPNHAPTPATDRPPLKLEVVGSDSGLREQHQIRLQIVLRNDGCNRYASPFDQQQESLADPFGHDMDSRPVLAAR